MQPRFALLWFIAKSLVQRAADYAGCPAGAMVLEAGEIAWAQWQKQAGEAERRDEIQSIVRAAGEEWGRQVKAVVAEVAADHSEQVRRQVEQCLRGLPDAIRQNWRRAEDPEGLTPPPGRPLDRPREFLSRLSEVAGAAARAAEAQGRLPSVRSAPGPAPESKVVLRVVRGKLDQSEYVLDERGTWILGRHPDCGVRFPGDEDHRNVSRYHSLIDVNPPAARIRDFGSLNGTYVNDENIGQRPKGQSAEAARKLLFRERDLKQGDQIRLGNTVLRVEIHDPAARAQRAQRAQRARCAECGAPIAGGAQVAATVSPGVFRCADCREQAKTAAAPPAAVPSGPADAPAGPARPQAAHCARCGRDLADGANTDGGEEALCAACQTDGMGALRQLLEQAAGDGELPAIRGYTFERKLGEGGMGAVCLALEQKTGKRMALKVMLPRVAADERATARFLREAELTRALLHSNIVAVHEVGCSGGAFYFTMEYCDGGSAADLRKRLGGRVPTGEACDVILQVLRGLEYAHSADLQARVAGGATVTVHGLVHRDLSPHNILLGGSGSGTARVAKVADFGLSKAFDLAGLSGQTATGSAAGKPCYVPRQQVINFKYAKPEVDVWAAAACLYNLLTGSTPRDFPDDADPWDVVLRTPAVPVRQRNPSVPPRLAEVIDEALKDNPAIGFKTAVDLRRALEAVI